MRSIVLVGFMGCGKSTVGRALADRLGWSLIDLDEMIAEIEGCTIPEIFAKQGEAAFRLAERRALKHAVTQADTVIASGGGLFSDLENRRIITEAGALTVYLDVPWPILEDRIGGQHTGRPLWESPAGAKELFLAREESYLSADATLKVDGGQSPLDVAEAIIQLRPELACAI